MIFCPRVIHQKAEWKRGCSKTKLTHEVCSTQLSPTLNDFPLDVAISLFSRRVDLLSLSPCGVRSRLTQNILQYIQGVKISFIEGIVPRQQVYPSMANNMKLSKMRFKVFFWKRCSENHALSQGSLCRPYFYAPRVMGLFVWSSILNSLMSQWNTTISKWTHWKQSQEWWNQAVSWPL